MVVDLMRYPTIAYQHSSQRNHHNHTNRNVPVTGGPASRMRQAVDHSSNSPHIASQARHTGMWRDLPTETKSSRPRKKYTIRNPRQQWTPEEHKKFVEAIRLYQRDWAKVCVHKFSLFKLKTNVRYQLKPNRFVCLGKGTCGHSDCHPDPLSCAEILPQTRKTRQS